MKGQTAYAIAMKGIKSIGTGIKTTSYDGTTGIMTVTTNDSKTFNVKINNGILDADRLTLDNISYDETTGELLVDGQTVVTETDTPTEDIDLSDMFG